MGFSGLNIGLSSLLAQRRALEVTGHNLSNVGTEGYSRQRVELAADAGPITPALWARYEGAGSGVKSGSITRMRDQFLELRGYQEHAANTQIGEVATTLERVEGLFAEPADTALAAQLADFWAGWDDIANRPDDPAARSQLLERAATLVATFNRMDGDLAAMRNQTKEELDAVVVDVNATAARIAELNGTIQSAVNSNLNANDLMDQRDKLIGHLAEQVGVTVRPGEAGSMDVFVGGTALVRGTTSEQLKTTVGAPPATDFGVAWVKDSLPADVRGTTGGMLQTANDIIPRYRTAVAGIASQLRDDTNAIHRTGFGLDGSTGTDFFVGTTSITVNPALITNPRGIAASADDPAAQTDGQPTHDGSIASRLAAVTGPDTTYRNLVVALGVEAQSANRRVDIQGAITKQVDNQREAESGVNLDEEMTNLVAYQHAYSAAARFVSAVDEMLNTLINGMGA